MRRLWWIAPALGALATAAVVLTKQGEAAPAGNPDAPAKTELKQATTLPISQVILFNSGVAHLTRAGEVEGDARVDLTFPEQDINDLIKSMTLRDLSEKGRVSSVTYDSHDPIDRTLKSFAINLNGAPTFASILQQARGEKVEVILLNNATQPGTIAGSIIGMEKQHITSKEGATDVDVLNLWCAEGVRSVKLSEVQRLRFINPIIESEFRRALEVLALSHDSQKKAVSLFFSGEGKRKVEVGYVIENPIWKTSYRLVLDKDKKEKPFLQGWAVVENPTDEDWGNVSMALVSGRPISFKMDLYNPLYVNRPTVEPELFASLRPPTYGGDLARHRAPEQKPTNNAVAFGAAPPPGAPAPMDAMRAMERAEKADGKPASGYADPQSEARRRFAGDMAKKMSEQMNLGGSVQTSATASQLGDYFQYHIDHPVNLARQKSALLPIVNKSVEAKRVSIYNPNVQAKHPLLGLKFKNTSGMNLSQGPITVYEGSTYAGDTRFLDLQPDEERLVSYAIDLGTEVAPKNTNHTSRITKVRAVKGIIYTTTLRREERVYDISNRSTTDRIVLIEHPNRKGQGFKFTGENKPAEEAADVYRFEVPVASKKDLSYTVTEERDEGSSIQLTNNSDDQIRHFISLNETTPELKAKLREALDHKSKWDNVRRDIENTTRRIQTITVDQKRLRDNMRELPQDSQLYKGYLKKLTDQEAEMDSLHESLKKFQASENAARTSLDNFLANLSIE